MFMSITTKRWKSPFPARVALTSTQCSLSKWKEPPRKLQCAWDSIWQVPWWSIQQGRMTWATLLRPGRRFPQCGGLHAPASGSHTYPKLSCLFPGPSPQEFKGAMLLHLHPLQIGQSFSVVISSYTPYILLEHLVHNHIQMFPLSVFKSVGDVNVSFIISLICALEIACFFFFPFFF